MSIESEIKKIVESCGAKLYDIETVTERGKTIYRVIITSPQGVDLQQCAEISNLISPILDVNPPVSGEYNLEVSSPGIERKLTKPVHFENSIGELVKIKHTELGKLKGKIVSCDSESVTIKDGSSKEEKKLAFGDILQAKTYYTW